MNGTGSPEAENGKGDRKMAELLQEEKQKVTFPEIRDTADSYAEEYTDGYTDELTEDGGDSSSAAIDVDIEDMVWEVDSEPADSSEVEDAYSGEIYENTAGQSAAGYEDRTDDAFYGSTDNTFEEIEYSRKCNNHIFTWVLSFVCGMYGVDRIVRGQVPLGIIKLLTFGGFGFWYLADLGIAIYKSYLAPDAMMQEDLHFDSLGRYV